jgi:hypothetical protein
MKEEIFDLEMLVCNWESVNLNPTVIIYRNGDTYLLRNCLNFIEK